MDSRPAPRRSGAQGEKPRPNAHTTSRQDNKPRPQAVTLTGKGKEGMEAVLTKMAIVGHPFLLAVGRVLGGIQVNYQPLLFLRLNRVSVHRVRAAFKASKPKELPRTSFSNRESMDWPAPALWTLPIASRRAGSIRRKSTSLQPS
jgi:hypothetical protein